MARTGPQPGQIENAAARAVQALELRKQGLAYRAIGERLGVSYQTAYRDVMDELEKLAELRKDKAEELRELELERLDRALLNIEASDGFKSGDPASVGAWVRLSESRRKLLGLDAPAKVDAENKGEVTVKVEYVDRSNQEH